MVWFCSGCGSKMGSFGNSWRRAFRRSKCSAHAVEAFGERAVAVPGEGDALDGEEFLGVEMGDGREVFEAEDGELGGGELLLGDRFFKRSIELAL